MDGKEIIGRIRVDIERSRMYGVRDDDITIIMTYRLYARLAGELGVVLEPEYSTLFGCPIRLLYDTETEEWLISTVHGTVQEADKAIRSDYRDDLRNHPELVKDDVEALDCAIAAIKYLEVCRNELCLRCGQYKQRHLGACDGCRWYEAPDDYNQSQIQCHGC